MPIAALTAQQVADGLGLSRKAVYRAIERGELAASKPCGRLRVRPEAVEAWLDATAVRPPADVAVLPAAAGERLPAGRLRALLDDDRESA